MLTFNCTNCGKQYSVDDKLAGRKAKCKACGAPVVVPSVSSPSPVNLQPADSPQPPAAGKPTPAGDAARWPPGQRAAPAAAPASVQPPAARQAAASQVAAAPAAPKKQKLPVRMRRLIADAQMLEDAFRNFPLIKIHKREGDPPELYQIIYRIRGLVRDDDGNPIYRNGHVVEIQLTSEYPRQCPKCRMITSSFHPNIEPSMICVGDHWTASERLVDLVIRIGEMIAYQAYNIKSPLDGDAAMWADNNRQHLPIDPRDLRPPDLD